MKIVIQCAARKNPRAGHLHTSDGRDVMFVADPKGAPSSGTPYIYAHPDDPCDSGGSWRDELRRYNEAGGNPLGLLPAWQLYENPTYGELARKYGTDDLYILSAGWGLISANFLTPPYDITFSNLKKEDRYKKRRGRDRYDDLCQLPDADEAVVFFVSKGYIDQACALTGHVKGSRHLFYNTGTLPHAPGCNLIRYETSTRTNWHYECAKAFMRGDISVPRNGDG